MSISIKNLHFTYAAGTPHETKAIDDICLDIEDGEFIGIMGKTGCGKSTLIQLIDGLLKPDSGTILLNGEDINCHDYDRNILRKTIGMVFQFPEYQLFETTVHKDVAFGLKHHGLSPEQTNLQVRESIETMGFDYEQVKDVSPLTFSGGEKRRIAIAGILAAKPRVLILDEPVAGLDPAGREAFLSLLDTINEKGVTIIMISHNADSIAEHTRRVIILKGGRLLVDGETRSVFSDTELLKKNDIGIGQVNEIAELMRKRGCDVPADVVRYDDLISFILNRKGGASS